MNETESELVIRRILVALDASRDSLAALEAAVDLAGGMEAELVGLFVEDVNLLRLACLPLARALRYPSATEEPVDSSSMERELRVQAQRARQALASAAERAQVRWSFRVVRGEVAAEVLAAASEVDVITLGRTGWSWTRRQAPGSTALRIATSAPNPMLLVQHGVALRKRMMTVLDGSKSSQQALSVAIRLAEKSGIPLAVLLLAETPAEAERLEKQARRALEGRKTRAHYRRLQSGDVMSLSRAVQSEGGGILVMSCHCLPLSDEAVHQLLGLIRSPILLIR